MGALPLRRLKVTLPAVGFPLARDSLVADHARARWKLKPDIVLGAGAPHLSMSGNLFVRPPTFAGHEERRVGFLLLHMPELSVRDLFLAAALLRSSFSPQAGSRSQTSRDLPLLATKPSNGRLCLVLRVLGCPFSLSLLAAAGRCPGQRCSQRLEEVRCALHA